MKEMDGSVDWKEFLGKTLSCNLFSEDCKDIISPSDSKSSTDTFIGSSKSKDDSGMEAYTGVIYNDEIPFFFLF